TTDAKTASITDKTTPTTTTTTYTTPSHWTTLTPTDQSTFLTYLNERCHPLSLLSANRYTTEPYHRRGSINFRFTPSTNPSAYAAVSLDCEMVETIYHEDAVVQVTLVDILTNTLLLDLTVVPTHQILDYRTKYSGMSASLMSERIAQGKTVTGYAAARAKIWEFINADTILVGQSLNNDLNVLGMTHWRIVDSFLLVKEGGYREMGKSMRLKALVEDFVGVEIQKGDGSSGHDCAEDAFAAREVVVW
ncbi:hypothetical protein BO78DRAFT_286133, partial [Aspergillus sclerotiicarbonarius CBS 121057]